MLAILSCCRRLLYSLVSSWSSSVRLVSLGVPIRFWMWAMVVLISCCASW